MFHSVKSNIVFFFIVSLFIHIGIDVNAQSNFFGSQRLVVGQDSIISYQPDIKEYMASVYEIPEKTYSNAPNYIKCIQLMLIGEDEKVIDLLIKGYKATHNSKKKDTGWNGASNACEYQLWHYSKFGIFDPWYDNIPSCINRKKYISGANIDQKLIKKIKKVVRYPNCPDMTSSLILECDYDLSNIYNPDLIVGMVFRDDPPYPWANIRADFKFVGAVLNNCFPNNSILEKYPHHTFRYDYFTGGDMFDEFPKYYTKVHLIFKDWRLFSKYIVPYLSRMEYKENNVYGIGLNAQQLIDYGEQQKGYMADFFYFRAALLGDVRGIEKMLDRNFNFYDIENNESNYRKQKYYGYACNYVSQLMEIEEFKSYKQLLEAYSDTYREAKNFYKEAMEKEDAEAERKRQAEIIAAKQRKKEFWTNLGIAFLNSLTVPNNIYSYNSPQMLPQNTPAYYFQNNLFEFVNAYNLSIFYNNVALNNFEPTIYQNTQWEFQQNGIMIDWNNCNTLPSFDPTIDWSNSNFNSLDPQFNTSDYWSEENRQARKRETLNRTYGENCMLCNGSGKCNACNGTKIASSFGNTYRCTVCNEDGLCGVCNGTGKSSWNR